MNSDQNPDQTAPEGFAIAPEGYFCLQCRLSRFVNRQASRQQSA